MTSKQAAGRAGVSESAVRGWVAKYAIGRRVAGSLRVSSIALEALLDDNAPALAAYLCADRTSALVTPYFVRAGLVA